MRKKLKYLSFNFLFIIPILLNIFCCKNEETNYKSIIKQNNPVIVIGSEIENLKDSETPIYKFIGHYCIDNKENVYIGDVYNRKIDKYDCAGNFCHSIGGPGQGPGEFSEFPFFAASTEGKIICAYRKIAVFDPTGIYLNSIEFEEPYKKKVVVNIKIDIKNNVYLLFYMKPYVYELVKTDLSFSNYKSIHKDDNRIDKENKIFSGVTCFYPDFCIDLEGNIYVTDTIDYKVFIYSRDGELLDEIEKESKKIKIKKDDFNFPTFKGNEIHSYQNYFNRLYGPHKYLPSIFGVNIDDGKIFIWTSEQDNKRHFFIDIYDLKWQLVCRSSHVNFLKRNFVIIKNGKFYSPNIDSSDLEFKKMVSRIAYYNAPYKILIFDLLL